MLKELVTRFPSRPDRDRPPRPERPARPAPAPDRARGPAVPTAVEGVSEVAGIVDRHLVHCRRHRRPLALVCVAVDAIDAEGALGLLPDDLECRIREEVINRVCARVRGGDLILRPNARDACVLLPGTSEDAARRVAARFQQALDGDYRLDDQLLRVRVRVGSAAHPQDGMVAPELLRRATGW